MAKKTIDQLSVKTSVLDTDVFAIGRWSTTYQFSVANLILLLRQSGTWTPVWFKTPVFIWQTYLDTTNENLWFANWLTNTNWIKLVNEIA